MNAITIYASEVRLLTAIPWDKLSWPDRKGIVAQILTARGQIALADKVAGGIPAAQNFVLVDDRRAAGN